MTTWEKRLFEC
ncbi:hypothetical protein Pint_33292 [Pistacia integerrima]|uniref:Uncharacterized protein n=1 Tax=Pistacia integerrima TaxID=434235 RepID=A0ACC0X6G5_9ROSI|nr:hypothetical protein Pint_33292 [Pistacia integerrima]